MFNSFYQFVQSIDYVTQSVDQQNACHSIALARFLLNAQDDHTICVKVPQYVMEDKCAIMSVCFS